MKRIGIVIAPLFFLLFQGCTQKEIIPDGPEEAKLRSVMVKITQVVLPPGGTATVDFSVDEPDFVFSDVRLMRPGGKTPEEVTLESFSAGASKGSYTAILADSGKSEAYSFEVCLSIVSNGEYVSSSYFTVKTSVPSGMASRTGLPVVYVDTEGGKAITSKTDYLSATLSILGDGGYEGLAPVSCQVRGRGNTTWSWPKKPYLIKLDEKEHIFGMHKHKRWVLLANILDRTLMRNLVSMKVSSMTSLDWTPGCVPVELVLNGAHVGSYLLIEQVRVDNHRVAVTEMTAQDNEGEAVTGGYLLECDFHYDNEIQWTDPHGHNGQWGNGIPFGVKYPDPDEITPAQLTYIKGYITETANVLYGSNFKDPENGYAKYIDVDSFVDYWIVFEVMCNHELGNPGSVFFHKDRGGKLVAGPCWDFDWGVLSFYTSGGQYNLVNSKAIWYERLFQDPAFKEKVKNRFQELLPQLETIPAYMDECEALLQESARLNFMMWNPADDSSMNGGHIINGDENMSFHAAISRLKDNYRTHLQIISKKL